MAKRFAVLGRNVQNSLSPDIHDFIAKYYALDLIYEKKDVPDELELKRIINSGIYDGFNITMPYKEVAQALAVKRSPEVELLKSANTFIKTDSGYEANSTDGAGFIDSLIFNGVDVKNKSAYVYGLGGAGRQVALSLLKAGVSELYYLSRSEDSRRKFRDLITLHTPYAGKIVEHKAENPLNFDIVVNASSLGNDGSSLSIDLDMISCELVYDIIYVPITKLLIMASEKGIKSISGLDMLICQAIRAFRFFFPDKAKDEDAKVLFSKLKSHLG